MKLKYEMPVNLRCNWNVRILTQFAAAKIIWWPRSLRIRCGAPGPERRARLKKNRLVCDRERNEREERERARKGGDKEGVGGDTITIAVISLN